MELEVETTPEELEELERYRMELLTELEELTSPRYALKGAAYSAVGVILAMIINVFGGDAMEGSDLALLAITIGPVVCASQYFHDRKEQRERRAVLLEAIAEVDEALES